MFQSSGWLSRLFLRPYIFCLLVFLVSIGMAAPLMAKPLNFCVFDPLGKSGAIFQGMREYQLWALAQGVELKLLPRPSERIAADEFASGECAGVVMTGTRARGYNFFTGSIQAVGAIPDYEHLKILFTLLASPKAADLMVNGNYEVAGIFPGGAVYLFTNDQRINSMASMAGKKIAVLEHDHASLESSRLSGASIVASSPSDFATKFNNGSVDMTLAPIMAFFALELYRGMGASGGIVRYPLAQFDFQLLIHRDRFPQGFGQRSRAYALQSFDEIIQVVSQATAKVDEKYWYGEIGSTELTQYETMARDMRIKLRDEGVYHGRMLALIKKIRCRLDAARAECADKKERWPLVQVSRAEVRGH